MPKNAQTCRTDHPQPLKWGLIVGGLILLAIIVRLPFWDLPVRCDEAAAFLRYSGGGSETLWDFLSRYSTPGRHGFHGLAVALMSLLFGADFPWLRLPAFVAGVLSVPLTFAAMRLWIGRAPAAIAALLMAVSHGCVGYSVNARGYTVGICFVLVSVWYLAKADRRQPGWYPIAAGMALGAAAYTIHTTIYFAAAVAAWYGWRCLIDASGRARLVRAGSAFALSLTLTLVVLFLPIMVRGDFGNVVGYRIAPPIGFADTAALLPEFLRDGAARIADGVKPAAGLWLAVAVGAAVAIRRRNAGGGLMLMALAVVPVILLLQRLLPPVRTLNYLLPFAYALAGIGLVATLRKLQSLCRLSRLIPAPLPVGLSVITICAGLGSALASLPRHPLLRPDRDQGIRNAIQEAAHLAGPDEVIFAQSWINALIRYEQWKMRRPANRIVLPRLDVSRAVLFWPPHWRENKEVTKLLASYRSDEVLFDDGTTRIVRIARIDESVAEPKRPKKSSRLASASEE